MKREQITNQSEIALIYNVQNKLIKMGIRQKFPISLLPVISIPATLFFTSIFFIVPFFSTPINAKSKETGVLFLWEITSGEVWKSFGDDETQQKYKGEIKEGKPEGWGIALFPDGTKYMGQWHDGKQHGQGTFIFTSGEKMTGEWRENKEWNLTKYDINGEIITKYANGILLNDYKKEGVIFFRQEFGSMEWFESGDEEKHYKFEGEIENGKPNGWGIFTYPSGNIYKGNFKEGKFHGQGTFTSIDGKKGVGEFKENKPWNVIEFDKKDNIIAKYNDGVEIIVKKLVGTLFTRKEKGEWIWFEKGVEDEGGKYKGEIENGRPNGMGSLIYRNGTRYVGEFKDGSWNGRGVFFFPDGERWVGDFREDAPWDIRWIDRDGNIIAKWGNGVKLK